MFRCTGSFLKLWTKNQKVVWKRTSFDSYFLSSFTSAEADVSRAAYNQYKDCLRQNSKFYVSSKSSYAKTKYKLQNTWDHLVHGKKEKASAQVAFMITQDMKQSLADLGYSGKEIGNLKPAYAQFILTKNISYATWKVSKEVLIEEYEKEENKRRQEAAEEAARLAAEELAKQQQQQSEQTEQTDSSDHSNQSESSETTNTTTNTTKSSGLVAIQESSSSETDNTENTASPSLMIVEDKKKENDSF